MSAVLFLANVTLLVAIAGVALDLFDFALRAVGVLVVLDLVCVDVLLLVIAFDVLVFQLAEEEDG